MGKKKFKSSHSQPDRIREVQEDEFSKMMEGSMGSLREFEVGDEVEAVIIDFDTEHAFLDVGSRLDGLAPISQFLKNGHLTVNIGDKVKVYVTDRRNGAWILSAVLGIEPEKTVNKEEDARRATMRTLEDAFHRQIPVEGKVSALNKGGFDVQIMGQRAFCPISQIDNQYCEEPGVHLNKTYVFKLIRFEESGNNIVVSRREILDREQEILATKLWEQLDETKTYEGVVTSLMDFGAFVDIGGLEGLLHISEISYERGLNVHDHFKSGDKITVAIKSVDREKRKISLSLKSLMQDPWVNSIAALKKGGEIQGKVVRMKTFGAWVELFPGVDGFLHVSQLGDGKRHQHPKEVLKIGEMITVQILEMDEANKRISLTMEKQEADYKADMERIRYEQDSAVKSTHSSFASQVDKVMKPGTKQP